MTASTQAAIETIRQALICDEHTGPDCPCLQWAPEAHAALAAVEADLRRYEELAVKAQDSLYSDGWVVLARAALTPVSPSEPVPQQAEEGMA